MPVRPCQALGLQEGSILGTKTHSQDFLFQAFNANIGDYNTMTINSFTLVIIKWQLWILLKHFVEFIMMRKGYF